MVGGLVEVWVLRAGWFLDDRRIWVNDAAWEHARWVGRCCRSVDVCEDVSAFWKPGMTTMEALEISGRVGHPLGAGE
jgi:site-specific DNA-methyltransferase (adenine-specific)